MRIFSSPPSSETQTRGRILQAAQRLFAAKGFEGTTTRDLAQTAGVAEGTLFRHFANKKAILVEVATSGWVDILTDLLTELSEMGSYQAIAQVMRRRMWNLQKNADIMRVCFMEVQFHPDLRDRIQTEVIDKMTDVAEAFFQTAIDKGIYRQMDAKLGAKVFLGLFAIAGFSDHTLMDPNASPQEMQKMAEGLADIFLNGVLARE
ncbi:TetR/AcrR family transcriptional regulator [Dolichospermum sp. LEGE 00240]|jgi:AcrR family transcriptional regulator|uniref:TetR/AcrR family transcriptional regulator n=1 Tax=Dolichospermum sp. LEGE 00240 TaxID=1828603 RepID=UPI00188219C6|nr:TetR/AcrR family transcriptional regulator [Dolichospermum sp. LEGE 00240]MDM3846544.1 TetR/AcrR family transcriptional regulator [Aphanizomenon gracile PMC638.10]MDM3848637.1 TetR/AcrR family transcriptional regulator [Aphanizomenon gracile PMC627.10]MDM3853352.1 TetR/AcrR family transcriptional regulator [Aphanizomenon gracile PMC649.10]MDM3861125.1 TetR/AcrR family transcriptional regulator [Aphanizomenon gracile PMC644.10]MBE9251766.1 TetR/AcrR family transcriptional regulator [Dolichos